MADSRTPTLQDAYKLLIAFQQPVSRAVAETEIQKTGTYNQIPITMLIGYLASVSPNVYASYRSTDTMKSLSGMFDFIYKCASTQGEVNRIEQIVSNNEPLIERKYTQPTPLTGTLVNGLNDLKQGAEKSKKLLSKKRPVNPENLISLVDPEDPEVSWDLDLSSEETTERSATLIWSAGRAVIKDTDGTFKVILRGEKGKLSTGLIDSAKGARLSSNIKDKVEKLIDFEPTTNRYRDTDLLFESLSNPVIRGRVLKNGAFMGRPLKFYFAMAKESSPEFQAQFQVLANSLLREVNDQKLETLKELYEETPTLKDLLLSKEGELKTDPNFQDPDLSERERMFIKQIETLPEDERLLIYQAVLDLQQSPNTLFKATLTKEQLNALATVRRNGSEIFQNIPQEEKPKENETTIQRSRARNAIDSARRAASSEEARYLAEETAYQAQMRGRQGFGAVQRGLFGFLAGKPIGGIFNRSAIRGGSLPIRGSARMNPGLLSSLLTGKISSSLAAKNKKKPNWGKMALIIITIAFFLPIFFQVSKDMTLCPPNDVCYRAQNFSTSISNSATARIIKTATPNVNPGEDIQYNINLTYLGSGTASAELTDKIPENTTFKSAEPEITPQNGVLTWQIQDLKPNTPLQFKFTVTPTKNEPNYVQNYAEAIIRAFLADNLPPTRDNCAGKLADFPGGYTLNNPLGNFGDPDCSYSKQKLADLLNNLDPVDARYWFTVVIPCESGYSPNAHADHVAVGTPDSAGAWGLFQMGRGKNGQYDHGDVSWRLQVSNAVNYQNNILGSRPWAYWQCAKERW